MFSEWLADESSLSYCTQQLLLSWQRRTCAHSMTLIYNTPILHTLFHTLSTVWCYSKQLSKRTGSVSSQGFGEFFLAIVADSSSGVIAIELNRNATGFLHFHAPVLSDERERELLNTTSLTATRLVNTKKKKPSGGVYSAHHFSSLWESRRFCATLSIRRLACETMTNQPRGRLL